MKTELQCRTELNIEFDYKPPFEVIIDLTPDAIISFNINGVIISFNKSAEQMFRTKKQKALETPFVNMIPERFRKQHATRVQGLAASKNHSSGELIQMSAIRNGYEFPIEMFISKWTLNNDICFTAYIKDISSYVERERQKEHIDRLTNHNIIAPLNGILGFSELLLEDKAYLSRLQSDYIERIERCALAILEILDSSRELHKIEMGAYLLKPIPIDLLEIFSIVREDLFSLIAQKELIIDVVTIGNNMNSVDKFIVIGERHLCYSLLSNIVKNAIEASPLKQKIVVTFEIFQDIISFKIANKSAVPEAIRETFFEKYITSGKNNGSGLGTYLAKLMVKTMNGNIFLTTSTLTNDTEITIMLPRSNTLECF